MKFSTIPVLLALVFAVQAEVNSWYVSSKDITCTGDATGQITCIPGHTEGVEEVHLNHPTTRNVAIRGREVEVPGLQKRVTCNIDGVTQGLACFTHCFAIGYCNSHCDSNNICRCTCKDETQWWNPIVCSKTSC